MVYRTEMVETVLEIVGCPIVCIRRSKFFTVPFKYSFKIKIAGTSSKEIMNSSFVLSARQRTRKEKGIMKKNKKKKDSICC